MNESFHDEGAAEAPRLNNGTLVRVPETSALPDRELAENDAAVEGAWHARASPLREARNEWVASARTTVRGNPLACVAAAVAVGAVIARITR